MTSAVENLTPTRVKLNVEVPFEELKPSIDEAYKTVASQIQVPGFRKGKVPSKLIDQRVAYQPAGFPLDRRHFDRAKPARHNAVAAASIHRLQAASSEAQREGDRRSQAHHATIFTNRSGTTITLRT